MSLPTAPSLAVVGGGHAWPLLRAAGHKVRTIPDEAPIDERTLGFVEPEYGPTVLGPVQCALDGVFDDDASVVFDRDHKMAYLYVKELRRRGELPNLPPIHLFDFVASTGAAAHRHGVRQLHHLVEHLRRVTSAAVDADALAAESAAEEQLAAALRQLQARRLAERIDGVAAKRLLADRRSLPLDEVIRRVPGLGESSPDAPRVLVVPAASTASTRHHEHVAAAGGVVVDEDDWHGSRSVPAAAFAPSGDIDDLFTAMLASAGTDQRNPVPERTRWYEERLASGDIDAVVVFTSPDDQTRGWETPYRRRVAEGREVPFRNIHVDENTEGAVEQVGRDLAALVAEARERATT